MSSAPGPLYTPLLDKEEDDDQETTWPQPETQSYSKYWKAACLVQTALLIVILGSFKLYSNGIRILPESLIYSPARSVVEYEVNVFHTGFHNDTSKYQGTSDSVDQAWSDLYNGGISRIQKDEAALLPNKTSAIPGDEDHYIVSLHVFHDLHCLNALRQALYDDYYHKWNMSDPSHAIHLSHCIDSLRKTLMCNPDLGVIVWQWDEDIQRTAPQDTTAHQCVKFDNIARWAKERKLLGGKWDDDIEIPVYYPDGSRA
ncbi:hypothetical protein DL96DRAFT_1619954 [Flagelloscypha sp. PMI_526]|nr:hypothetical protein DL96DRAFT_1619954 [Flagelloscypha sp. PMI_526]